jgi:branched-subunit amino acid transport protein
MVVVMFVIQIAVFIYRCFSFQQLKKKTFPTMVGLSAIATSALFTAVAGTMVFMNGNGVEAACAVSTWVCIVLYMATKGQLYIFFIERMHIVHKKPSQNRMESPLYIFNMCLLIPFTALFVLMVSYRISFVGEDQRSRHGLRRESTIPGLIYDTMFSIYSIIVFVWPLFKSQSLSRSDGLRWVVKKNIIGSVVSTVSTFLNIFSYFNREVQDTDFCFLRCTADVMVNVLVMNYLISGGNRKSHQDQSTSYHNNKSSVVAHHHKGHGESEEVSNNPTKVYPMNENDSISPGDVTEITRMSTFLNTAYSEIVSTVSKQDLVIEEMV